MEITLTDLKGMVHKIKAGEAGAEATATKLRCPHCGEENILVSGTGKSIDPDNKHDTYRADAVHASAKCAQRIGVLRAKVNTLFGIEEDEAVFRLGIKIYS